jgi:hypothetical protein
MGRPKNEAQGVEGQAVSRMLDTHGYLGPVLAPFVGD